MRESHLDSSQKQKWDAKARQSKDGNKLEVPYRNTRLDHLNNKSVQETSRVIIHT